MEELWKDMSLPSTPVAPQYRHLQYSPATAAFSYRGNGVYRQDYLATASAAPLQPPRTPPPHPRTALTLEVAFLGHAAGTGAGTGLASSSGDESLHIPDPFAFSFPNNSRRVVAVPVHPAAAAAAAVAGDGDRRQRRMIKNRESAARSRARKQAYTNELEQELAQLKREHHMLVKREEDFHVRT
jgi:hypothetical protein